MRGYLETSGEVLTRIEIDCLPLAARSIAFEQGVRFLCDYLDGDVYYPIRRPDHNLERCRTQFKLLAEMEARSEAMTEIVEKYR